MGESSPRRAVKGRETKVGTQASEIVALVLSLTAAGVYWFVLRQDRRPRLQFLYLGALFMIGGCVFTVAEGFLWTDLLNSVEHGCYALSGVAFAAGCRRLARFGEPEEGSG